MSLMRPLEEMREMREQMNRLFQDFGEEMEGRMPWRPTGQMESGRMRSWLPAVEIAESGDNYTVKAEVPGIRPEDLNVEIVGNVLTVQGETRQEEKEEKKNVYRSELRYGRFMRQVQLPPDVDTENVQANFNHGILEMRLPKKTPENRRRIEIRPTQPQR